MTLVRACTRIGPITALVLFLATGGCAAQQPEGEDRAEVGGHFIWGAEVNVFSPCGSDQEYWVVADSATHSALRTQYLAFGLPPYEAVFVSVRGEMGPVLDCGFCDQYDGSFRVEDLMTMESPGPEDCVTEMGGG